MSNTLTEHVADAPRHVTAVERATWNGKVSPGVLVGYVNGAAYDSVTKKILLKNGNLIVSEIDASDFVKDGMVSSVAVVGENLVITFNTDAGKSPISIPLSDFAVQQVQSDWNQQDSSKKDFIKNKPTIPAPVDISGKLDGAAAYPAWVQDDYTPPAIVSHKGRLWSCQNYTIAEPGEEPRSDWLEVMIRNLKQDALLPAQMDAVNSGATAAKVTEWDGYAAQIAAKANAADVNAALAQKANADALSYALVTPGKWEFSGSGVQAGHTYTVELAEDYAYTATLKDNGVQASELGSDEPFGLTIDFSAGSPSVPITATRASLPGHLLDRAVNAVEVTGDTTLTLPALVNAGKARDLLVRLEISGSTVPTITFATPTGETITITYETDGDEFPVPDEAGTWLYSFTETAAHTFAVSLKKVNTVAQGGS